ncbi:unnamed protein product [Tuber melanosporum]|uniref:(Perigord truffle) hypothetical protein n=1 Tax=Tuber melanosporum (strain Mel28) TaxID=656061 RepID=D5GBJ8_TUBMM|nr:uncharacterized protein GSTUM_00005668001 [Tuber melanosporum]CAZ82004.1 unnamed protein product [Tuber melanosporum]
MEEAVASPKSLVDLDAVNITREFIDFTEFLPADMYRSLQLVRQLKKKAADHSRNVDLLCKEFASLPEQSRVLPPSLHVPITDYVCPAMSERETELRIRISNAIKGAQFAHREAKAEAERASQNINRHHARIVAIYGGLCKVTIPPDEPENKPAEGQQTDVRKIKIRISSQKSTPTGRHPRLRGSASIAQTSRSRYKQRERNNRDDDADDNEWEDIPSTPYNYEKIKKKKKLLGGMSRRGPKNNSESPFVGGARATNEDGSLIPNSLLPWNRLTNEELARLRKRMKKNSGWTPSVTMIIRELETLGRGPKHKEKYEDQWGGSRGDEFLKIYGPEDGGIGDPEKIAPDDGAGVRENKGMKLNRAKKRKREEEKKEKAKELEREKLEAKIEEEEKLRLKLEYEEAKIKREAQEEKERVELANRERERAKAEEEAATAAAAALEKERREKEEAAMEEKAKASAALREQEEAAAAEARVPQPITRSSSISSAASSSTPSESPTSREDEDSEMPDAVSEERPVSPPIPVPPPPPPKPRLGRPPKNPKPLKPSSSDSPPSSGEKRKRAPSTVTTILPTPSLAESRAKRGTSVAAPPTGTVSLAVGRKRSNVAGPKPNKPMKPSVGKKKGLVAGNNNRKRVDVQDTDGTGEWVDEEDEDLKTYCLCDEVSHGFMVQCDNEQCSKKWFHIDCVKLTEREAKDSDLEWFCPDCQEKRGKRRKKT